MNEDGWPDVLVYYWGRTPIAFLRKPDSSLAAPAFFAQELMPGRERWYSNSASLSDLDGDGHLDLIIGNTSQDGARILDAKAGGVEVLPESRSRAFNGGWNRILRWTAAASGDYPAVSFREVNSLLADEVARGWTLALGAADLDGDLLPEIYFANDYGPDRLLHNRSRRGHLNFALAEGKKTFFTPASFVMGHDSFKGMGIDFADMNGDGWLDMYVSNIAAAYAFQESHLLWMSTGEPEKLRQGIAPYQQASERYGLSRSGWAWDTRLADFDNDGVVEVIQATGFIKGKTNRWPEMQALGTVNDTMVHDPRNWPRFRPGDDLSGHEPNCFFVRDRTGRYFDVAREIGLGKPMVTRGIAVADVDGDGDLDMALANQYEPSVFYLNNNPRRNGFLGLNLLVPVSGQGATLAVHRGRPPVKGRPAIGAQATVILPGGLRRVAQVDGGSGHSGKRAPELHFGLGTLTNAPLRVELRWRAADGQPQKATLTLVPGWYTIMLGSENSTT
jgi:enediyne biosynthesis protein E4